MFATIQRALALISVILAVAHVAVPGATKTVAFVDPAVAKAQALLTAIAGLSTPQSAQAALDDLVALVGTLQQQGLIPAHASPVEGLIVNTDAMLHNYLGGQAVPVARISIEGKPGWDYAIPDQATPELMKALGRAE